MSNKCAACAKFVGRIGNVMCPKCSVAYHCACVGFPAGATVPRDWSCPSCKRYQPRDNHADTPVKGLVGQLAAAASSSSSPADSEPAASQSAAPTAGPAADPSPNPVASPASPFDAAVGLIRGCETRLLSELQAVRQEIKDFRLEFSDIRAHLVDFGKKVEALEGRVDAVEKAVAESTVTAATRALEDTIAVLQLELHERDQELLSNDVQLSNVPEEPGESAAGLAAQVCARLGVELDARDVVLVHRAGRAREAGRPRPLVLRLARRAVRDELLRAARSRRGATTEGLGLRSPPQKFYVNERLTSANRQLFQRAREAARDAAWRYVWTRDGKIFARRVDGGPSQRIRQISDLVMFKK